MLKLFVTAISINALAATANYLLPCALKMKGKGNFSNSRKKKGCVIPTKSFVKIGMTKVFCYNNKRFSSINETSGCCSKSFV